MAANPTSRAQTVENLDMLNDLDLDPPAAMAADPAASVALH
jgi:hypothetical protein